MSRNNMTQDSKLNCIQLQWNIQLLSLRFWNTLIQFREKLNLSDQFNILNKFNCNCLLCVNFTRIAAVQVIRCVGV